MDEWDIPEYLLEPHLYLELRGFEANTAQDVYCPLREVDAYLLAKLKSFGYEQRYDIKLSNGEIVDGWMKA